MFQFYRQFKVINIRNAIIIPIFSSLINFAYAGETDTSKLTLLFAGDIMGHDSQIASAYNDSLQDYVYDSCFKYIDTIIRKADIALANLEVTLAGKPYKGYPQFSSPDGLAISVKKAGFDVLITANNHSLDRGKEGLERTVDVLDSLGIIHTGTFKDSLERKKKYPLILEKNNIKIAILNYTYGTNGIKETKPNIVNYIDTAVIKNDLKKARVMSPDFVIVTLHWGLEYQRNENNAQKQLAKYIFAHGGDCIIGSHPHVVQPVKHMYADTLDSLHYNLVVYSLGNFISNQRKQYTDGGIIFNLELQKTNEGTRVNSYDYLPVWVYKPVTNSKTGFVLVPANSFEKGLGQRIIDDGSKSKMKVFYNDTKDHLKNVPENMLKLVR